MIRRVSVWWIAGTCCAVCGDAAVGPEWSAGFAAGRAAFCLRQSALWRVKRVVKARAAVLERKG